jgi:hypothetical protein
MPRGDTNNQTDIDKYQTYESLQPVVKKNKKKERRKKKKEKTSIM